MKDRLKRILAGLICAVLIFGGTAVLSDGTPVDPAEAAEGPSEAPGNPGKEAAPETAEEPVKAEAEASAGTETVMPAEPAADEKPEEALPAAPEKEADPVGDQPPASPAEDVGVKVDDPSPISDTALEEITDSVPEPGQETDQDAEQPALAEAEPAAEQPSPAEAAQEPDEPEAGPDAPEPVSENDNDHAEGTDVTDIAPTEGAGESAPSEEEAPEDENAPWPEDEPPTDAEAAGDALPFEQTESVGGVRVTVTADAGVLPDGSRFTIRTADSAELARAAESAFAPASDAAIFHHIYSIAGAEITGNARVKISGLNALREPGDGAEIAVSVYHWTAVKARKISASVSGTAVAFSISATGLYDVMAVITPSAPQEIAGEEEALPEEPLAEIDPDETVDETSENALPNGGIPEEDDVLPTTENEEISEEEAIDEANGEEGPAEEPAVDETSAEEPPADDDPEEETKGEESPAAEPLADEETFADEPAVDEPSAEEPPADDDSEEGTKDEESPAAEPLADEETFADDGAPADEADTEEALSDETVPDEAPTADEAPDADIADEDVLPEETIIDAQGEPENAAFEAANGVVDADQASDEESFPFNVTIDPNIEHGSITWEGDFNGDYYYVVLTTIPEPGYRIDSVSAIYPNGESSLISSEGTNTYRFILYEDMTFTAVFIDERIPEIGKNNSFFTISSSIEHGTITLSAGNKLIQTPDELLTIKGHTVITVNVYPEEGYSLKSITVEAVKGNKTYILPVETDYTIIADKYKSSLTFTVTAYFEPIPSQEPRFSGHSLVLSGSIGLDFYVTFPGDISGYTDVSMSFVGQKLEKTVSIGAAEHVSGSDYKFTCYMSSIQMASEITPTLHYTVDGVAKTLTGEPYSAEDYLKAYIARYENNSDEAARIRVAKALADYGHYAQPYLSRVNNWTLGSTYDAMDTSFTESYNIEEIKAAAADSVVYEKSLDESHIARATFSLTADYETSINLYLTPAEGQDITSVTVDGAPATAVRTGARYRVTIPQIKALMLDHVYTVTVDGNTTIQLSALSYVKVVLTSSEAGAQQEDIRNFCAALYQYGKSFKEE